MSRRARGARGRRALAEHFQLSRPAQIGIVALALAGMAVSGYLTAVHLSGTEALCVAGSGCDIVQESDYAVMVGIPVALVGLVGYVAILASAVGWFQYQNRGLVLYLLVLAGFVFSSYLTFVELFVIRVVCPYCLVSYGLIAGILAVLLIPRAVVRGLSVERYKALTVGVVVVVPLISVALQWDAGQSPAEGPTGYAASVARHLTEAGAAMYGAYWCHFCDDQKALFGSAFEYVDYVECDPNGKNANPFLCARKGIQVYPTWEIGGRFYTGVYSLEELAQLSGFAENGS